MCVQLNDDKKDSENQPRARAQLIDIVEAAGDVGFETLVRALAKNDQETLAKQLDEELAGRFIKKPPEVASTHHHHHYCIRDNRPLVCRFVCLVTKLCNKNLFDITNSSCTVVVVGTTRAYAMARPRGEFVLFSEATHEICAEPIRKFWGTPQCRTYEYACPSGTSYNIFRKPMKPVSPQG